MMKEKLDKVNKEFFINNKLTIEKINIANEIFNELENSKNSNFVFGICGDIGSGKTFLLNYIIKELNIKDRLKENIFYCKNICIIDDIKNENFNIKEIMKNFDFIIFSFNPHEENKIEFEYKKLIINEENKIFYMNIDNHEIEAILKKFSNLPFGILKIFNEKLNDERKLKWAKNEILRSQKLIEWYIDDIKLWEEVKKDILINKRDFPIFNSETKNMKNYLELGLITWKNNHFEWNFDDILFLIIFREWMSLNKNNILDILNEHERKIMFNYVDNSNIFQNSWINYLKEKHKINLLKETKIFLSSTLHIKSEELEFKPKIIFDISSLKHVYILFKESFLPNNIKILEIINNSFKIVYPSFLNDYEIDEIQNNFTDIQKILIFAFMKIHECGESSISLKNINWLNIEIQILDLLKYNELTQEGIFILSYIILIFYENGVQIKNKEIINIINEYLKNIYDMKELNKENFVNKMELYNDFDHQTKTESFFCLIGHKENLLTRTRIKLNETIKRDKSRSSIFHHQYLFQFNSYMLKIFEKIKKNDYLNFYYKNNDYIKEITYIGFSDFLPYELNKNEFNFIEVIRDVLIWKLKNE